MAEAEKVRFIGQRIEYNADNLKCKEETNMQVRTYCTSWAIIVVGVSLMLRVFGVA